MSEIRKVAHIGASGFIGSAVLEALIASDLDVTVLARKQSNASFPEHIKVIRVDFDDQPSIVEALQGQDAVVSTVGVKAIKTQYKIIDAAIEAGVKRFIPSEFGCDITNPKTANLPAYKEKFEIIKYLQSVAGKPGSTLSYSTISTSVLVEAVLAGPLPDIKVKDRCAMIFDGGDVPVSMTPASLVGEAVVAVLKKPEETRNKSILIHGGVFTQNQALSLVQEHVGANEWEIDHEQTSEMEKRSWRAFESEPENILGWLLGFVRLGLYGGGYGGDFTGRTMNAELGLEEFSVEDLDTLIKEIVERP